MTIGDWLEYAELSGGLYMRKRILTNPSESDVSIPQEPILHGRSSGNGLAC
jgi:hypothetical protein